MQNTSPAPSLVEHFQSIKDPGVNRTKDHDLIDILVIAICTLLCGGEGFNDMDVFDRHGLRAQLQDPLLAPESFDDSSRRARRDAPIDRVRRHPALYACVITDEPNAKALPGLGRLVARLRNRDPAHLAYISLLLQARRSARRLAAAGR